MVVVPNEPGIHNVVVCTLCSCYPWPAPEDRARVVREPRQVLEELGLALVEAGVFEQDEFRARLIAEIATWEANPAPGEPYRYYACWLAALEALLTAKGLSDPTQLDTLTQQLADRPAGHDHGHPHRG